MKAVNTALSEVKIIEPHVFQDDRGFFFESYNKRAFAEAIGSDPDFVQDNHSRSAKGVLRGLHFQDPHRQAKLVRVIAGEVYDVVVDIRKESATYGQWLGINLTAENHRMLWIPEGFAHGFLALSEGAELVYKTTDYYHPDSERCLLWNDPEIGIEWPLFGLSPLLSNKDKQGKSLKEFI